MLFGNMNSMYLINQETVKMHIFVCDECGQEVIEHWIPEVYELLESSADEMVCDDCADVKINTN